MKRKISIILLLIATLMFSLLAFTACGNDNDENGAKQVPVYQGMTITKSNSVLSLASYRMSGIKLLSANNENNGDNGNHYGHYKGDHTDRNDRIDEDNPYPDNNANENIEEEIKSSLNVVGSPDEIYYATPNEDIYINIHIDNPDSFEIMSFTLNGKKYSSYMFEEGSDMETIVLKYNVGDATGIIEYTIDAIKYIDGTKIKDVIIDGNKTVMAGIRTENQVVANVTDVDIDTNVLSFNVNIKDNDRLIAFSKGALKTVIYDGFEIVATKDLVVGANSVNFENLKTNTLYQYAVVGYYDDLSGGGFGMNVLYKDAFYTDSVVLFDNITVEQESISFCYLWHEDHQGKAISALKLYKGDAFIKDITASATTVNELLSGTTYKLVAEYPNADKTESIYLEFTTLAKAVPEISVHTPTSTQTSVGFTVTEADEGNVGAVTKIELVHASGTTLADSLDQRTFANLLSNNEYTVKVTYTYNLNDGTGDKTIVKELAITTLAKATPEISVVNPTKTQTSIGFEINETDADNVSAVTKIELVHANGTVAADSLDQRIFENLLSNNAYTIKVTYVYDLNDGEGEHTVTRELSITTLAKATPEISVVNPTKTQTSVGFEINETDADNVGAVTKIELIHANGTVEAESLDVRSFTNLLSNNTYTVKVTYTYDLNDGEGVHTVTKELAVTTDAKNVPSFTVKNENITSDTFNAEYDITDIDNILSYCKVELYKGDAFVSESTEKELAFDGLTYYTDYTVRFTFEYDLNDGAGTICNEFTYSFKTKAYFKTTQTNVINTAGISIGDTLVIQINVENPSRLTPQKVLINGVEYAVSTTSTKNKIYVDIINNGDSTSGTYDFYIEKIYATIDGEIHEFEISENNVCSAYIYGLFVIDGVDVVKKQNNTITKISDVTTTSNLYYRILAKGHSGYDIVSITIENVIYTNFIILDDETLLVPATAYIGWNTINTVSIKYTIGNDTKECGYSTAYLFYAVNSLDVTYITTAEQLKNMQYGKCYLLMNDIDLSGVVWNNPGDFNGYFDGNGYTIRNLTFAQNIDTGTFKYGLFATANGVIENLRIEDVYISITDNYSGDIFTQKVFVGMLCGEAGRLKLKNVSSTGAISVSYSYSSTNPNTRIHLSIGGIVGCADDFNHKKSINLCIFENCSSEASFVGKVDVLDVGYDMMNIGGLLGEGRAYIYNSYAIANIYADSESNAPIGGLVGSARPESGYLGAEIIAINSYAIVDLIYTDHPSQRPGLLGSPAYSGDIHIENCFTNTPIITNKNMEYYNHATIINVLTSVTSNSDLSEDFIKKWDDSIWDFSELDVENGKYPKLKQ